MPVTISPTAYVIGSADVYYRAVGVLTAWTSIGSTLDDAIMRIRMGWFRPDNINGTMGPVMGLDILNMVDGEIEFTMPEIASSKLGLAIPGVRETAASVAATGGGGSSTLSAATVAGDTSITVASATNFAVGDIVKIDIGSLAEYRQITSVTTTTTFNFRDPLLLAHASGVAAVETDGDNRTLLQSPIVRRQPDSAYKEWALVVPGASGYYELRIPRGIPQMDTAELTIGEETVAGIRVVIGARYNGAALTTSPWQIYAPA